MKKLCVVLLALLLVVPSVSATCPATWNDPNLTCIITQNWHDFVNNWTYQNSSIWYKLNNVSATSVSFDGVMFQNGTRIMTGSLDAGGFVIRNVTSPSISNDTATKGYVDTQDNGVLLTADSHITTNISSVESLIGGWIQTNNSATLSTADSHIASNVSMLNTTMNNWIFQNNTATLNNAIIASTANMSISGNTSFPASSTNGDLVSFYGTGGHTVIDSGIPNSSVFLTTGSRPMTGAVDMGGYKVSNAADPTASADLVTLNYFNAHPGGGRTKLMTPTIYYVATTGSDTTGDGSSSNPWATLQHACDYISGNVDPNSYMITIKLASGTYASGTIITTSWVSGFGLFIYGDDITPSNVQMPNIAIAAGTTLPSVVGINGITFTDSTYAIYHDGTGLVNAHNVVASGGGAYSSFNRAAILRVNNVTQSYGGIS